MPKAQRGGTDTYWRSWGDAPAKALLIHCSLGHSGAWKGFAPLLGKPCVAFDLPGHGQSGPLVKGVDFHAQATAVAADFLGDAPIDVIGHSFGATVALRQAMENPAHVRRLVLIEPVLMCAANGSKVLAAYDADFAPFIAAMKAGEPLRAAEIFTSIWGAGVDWADMREGQRQGLADQIHIIPAEDPAIYGDNAGLLREGWLEATDVPVLLLEGSDSPPVIGAIADGLAARLPNVTREVLPGMGHMAPLTHPVEVAKVVRGFLV